MSLILRVKPPKHTYTHLYTQALQLPRRVVGVLTPYIPSVASLTHTLLAQNGFTVGASISLGLEKDIATSAVTQVPLLTSLQTSRPGFLTVSEKITC